MVRKAPIETEEEGKQRPRDSGCDPDGRSARSQPGSRFRSKRIGHSVVALEQSRTDCYSAKSLLKGHQRDTELLTIDTVAREYRIHPRTLRAAARDGRLQVTLATRSVFGTAPCGVSRGCRVNGGAAGIRFWQRIQLLSGDHSGVPFGDWSRS